MDELLTLITSGLPDTSQLKEPLAPASLCNSLMYLVHSQYLTRQVKGYGHIMYLISANMNTDNYQCITDEYNLLQ